MKVFDNLNLEFINPENFCEVINSIYNPSVYDVNNFNELLSDNSKKIILKTDKNFKTYLQNQTLFINKWIKVYKQIESYRKAYLNKLKQNIEKDIEILFISEAPPLKIIGNDIHSKYIFGEDESIGSYRKAPFNAIRYVKESKTNEKSKVTNNDIIELFVKHNVGFIDLIKLPMPNSIPTELRDQWSFGVSNETEEPFVIQMLNHAIDEFKNETKRKLSNNLIIILMLPVKTALGIIDYSIKYSKKDDSFICKYRNQIIKTNTNQTKLNLQNNGLHKIVLRLHKQIVTCDAGSPHKSLIINALL
jgi:hypothetical protein